MTALDEVLDDLDEDVLEMARRESARLRAEEQAMRAEARARDAVIAGWTS